MMKKLALESEATSLLQTDATVYITDSQVSSVQLENGVGAQYVNSCRFLPKVDPYLELEIIRLIKYENDLKAKFADYLYSF